MKNLYWISSAMLLASTTAWPLGIRISDQDAQATARGNAFAATADNPSALYYNPAGISQLEGHNVRAGVYGISLESTVRNTATGSYSTIGDAAAVPQLYYTFSPEESRLSFGLGVYSPYGLSLEWPDAVPFRTTGVFGSIKYFSINPVVSLKITDKLFRGAVKAVPLSCSA